MLLAWMWSLFATDSEWRYPVILFFFGLVLVMFEMNFIVKVFAFGECRLCILAGNISPIDVITHVPILCEEAEIPYIYVTSKEVSVLCIYIFLVIFYRLFCLVTFLVLSSCIQDRLNIQKLLCCKFNLTKQSFTWFNPSLSDIFFLLLLNLYFIGFS